jgi:hypothetical protein
MPEFGGGTATWWRARADNRKMAQFSKSWRISRMILKFIQDNPQMIL